MMTVQHDDIEAGYTLGDPRGVFFDLFEPAQAAVLQARAELLMAIGREISARGWTPAQAARHLEVSTARVRQLVDDGGDFDAFTLEQLTEIAGTLELQ
jgi:predicted XRE-type DNA-binding protein